MDLSSKMLLQRWGSALTDNNEIQTIKKRRFAMYSIIFRLILCINFILEIALMLTVVYFLYEEPFPYNSWWPQFMLSFVLVALTAENCFSLYWYHLDNMNFKNYRRNFTPPQLSDRWVTFRYSLHMLGLAYVARNFEGIIYGLQSGTCKKDEDTDEFQNQQNRHLAAPKQDAPDPYYAMVHADYKASVLGMSHSFTTSTTMMMFQIYTISVRPELPMMYQPTLNTVFAQLALILLQLFSVTLQLLAYEEALHAAVAKQPLSKRQCVIFFIWRCSMLLPRILSMALFASFYPSEFYMFLGFHWGIMIVWILAQRTHYCMTMEGHTEAIWKETLFNVAMGYLYIFIFLRLAKDQKKGEFIIFHIITFLENMAMILGWALCTYCNTYLHKVALAYLVALVPGAFALSSFFSILKYGNFQSFHDLTTPTQR